MAERRSYKRSLLENSPAIQEHEETMDEMLSNTQQTQEPAPAPSPAPSESHTQPTATVNVQMPQEPFKNVQCRIPLSLYMQLSQMKYTSGPRTSIGDIAAKAIEEYVQKHAK